MKLAKNFGQERNGFGGSGKCHVCQLPVKGNDHRKCAEKARVEAQKTEAIRRANRKYAKKQYRRGYVPPFANT